MKYFLIIVSMLLLPVIGNAQGAISRPSNADPTGKAPKVTRQATSAKPVTAKSNQSGNAGKKKTSVAKAESKISSPDGTIANVSYVDLALPSGTLWATSNLGASKTSDKGFLYAWGETQPKRTFSGANSKTSGSQINIMSGNPNYDAAQVIYGSGWRTPTVNDFVELIDYGKWNRGTFEGVEGFEVTGPNGKSIFLPMSATREGDTDMVTDALNYWSADPFQGDNEFACQLYTDDNLPTIAREKRFYGMAIRPVYTEPTNLNSSTHKADIKNVWIEENADVDGHLGLKAHINMTVDGMTGNDARATIYFYDSEGNPLNDLNNSYGTEGDNPRVASSVDFKAETDNEFFNDFVIGIPYSELHYKDPEPTTLSLSAVIWDQTDSEPKALSIKRNIPFLFTRAADSSLSVNGQSTLSRNYTQDGASETFNVSSDAFSWDVIDLPAFCDIVTRTPSSLTLKIEPNDGAERKATFKIKTDNHSVPVSVRQAAADKNRINRIWVDHNEIQNDVKGMKIHLDFEVGNANGHTIRPIAYLFNENGTPLEDLDGQFCTMDGQVSTGVSTTSTAERMHWKDFEIFFPYNQLHLTQSGFHSLYFVITVWDMTGEASLIESEKTSFSYKVP